MSRLSGTCLVPGHLRNLPQCNKQRNNHNTKSNSAQRPPFFNQFVAFCIRLCNIPAGIKSINLLHSRNDCEKGKGKDAQRDHGIDAHELLETVGRGVVSCGAVGNGTEGEEGNINPLGDIKVGAEVGDSVCGGGNGAHLGDEDAGDVNVAAYQCVSG
jgi:hypothetical protein